MRLLLAFLVTGVLAGLYEHADSDSAFDWLHTILLGMGL